MPAAPSEADQQDQRLQALPLPQVILQFKDGKSDPARSRAASEILRRFEPLLRKYFRRTREPLLGYEDFIQEVMVRLLLALPGLRDPISFPGLMRQIVVGTMADALRKRTLESVPLDPEMRELASTFDSAISTALVVRSCLEMLPPPEQAVMERVIQDRSAAEIGHELGMTDSTVRMYKSRAVNRLRRILRE